MKESPKPSQLHPRNPHQGRYDMEQLLKAKPELAAFIQQNPRGEDTVDFSDPNAVKCLNGALLAAHYGVQHWDIPDGYLCPPIPGRADYIHHLADLLAKDNGGVVPKGAQVRGLDVGVGANCIYPILGNSSYGWQFVGTDIDPVAVESARRIVSDNPSLSEQIELRLQENKTQLFTGVVEEGERFDFCLCNPPFHASAKAAAQANQRKRRNLSGDRSRASAAKLNFSGKSTELFYKGGEIAFLTQMARESAEFAEQFGYFSSLVSKSDNVPLLKRALKQVGAARVDVVEMRQGQKISRFVAWRFS